MKKIVFLFLICLVAVCFASCGHEHQWLDATCETAKTCSTCGAMEGGLAEHSYLEATCTAPKTCSVCHVTEGAALGHSYAEATCTAPKTCSVCNGTEGEAKGHSYKNGICTVCDAQDPLAKDKQLAICESIIKDLEILETACRVQTMAYRAAWYFAIYDAEDYYTFEDILAAFSKRIGLDSDYVLQATIDYLESLGMETTKGYGTAALRTTSGALAITQRAMELKHNMSYMCEAVVDEVVSFFGQINANVIGERYSQAVLNYGNVMLNYYEFAKSPSGSYNSYTADMNEYESLCANAKNAIKIAQA